MTERGLTLAQARRIALAAQGFTTVGSARRVGGAQVSTKDLLRIVSRLGVIQIDSVNVLVRAHYMPFFSRLGDYDRCALDTLRDKGPRRVVEYWAHEASLVSPALWPLLAWQMRRVHHEDRLRRLRIEHPEFVDLVRAQVDRRGPITARALEALVEEDLGERRRGGWWNRSLTKHAVEDLFRAGEISSAGRTSQFERRYASLARTFGAATLPAVDPATLTDEQVAADHVQLVRQAAQALGVATEQSLADYFRTRPAPTHAAIERLLAAGELQPARVAGWRQPAYLWAGTRVPREVHVRALLSPFDNLIFHRPRTEALFGMRYRLEIYVPAAQRVFGYYVLPFLFGDSLVARVDLKADRLAGVLRVHAVHWEPDAPAEACAALDDELVLMAGWLGLSGVLHGS